MHNKGLENLKKDNRISHWISVAFSVSERRKNMNYAVVGFGTAGYHAVKVIRACDQEGEIDVYAIPAGHRTIRC